MEGDRHNSSRFHFSTKDGKDVGKQRWKDLLNVLKGTETGNKTLDTITQ